MATDETIAYLRDEYGPERGGLHHEPSVMAVCDAVERLQAACEGMVGVFDYLEAVCGGGFIPVLLGIDWQQRVAVARAALRDAEANDGD